MATATAQLSSSVFVKWEPNKNNKVEVIIHLDVRETQGNS